MIQPSADELAERIAAHVEGRCVDPDLCSGLDYLRAAQAVDTAREVLHYISERIIRDPADRLSKVYDETIRIIPVTQMDAILDAAMVKFTTEL
jgi:hypothetical protein